MSEVDSQMGATPFNVMNQEFSSFGNQANGVNTPRESSVLQIAPAQPELVKMEDLAKEHIIQTQRVPATKKATDQPNYSPMMMGNLEDAADRENKSVDRLRKD